MLIICICDCMISLERIWSIYQGWGGCNKSPGLFASQTSVQIVSVRRLTWYHTSVCPKVNRKLINHPFYYVSHKTSFRHTHFWHTMIIKNCLFDDVDNGDIHHCLHRETFLFTILFYSVLFYSILFHSIPFHSILFYHIMSYYVLQVGFGVKSQTLVLGCIWVYSSLKNSPEKIQRHITNTVKIQQNAHGHST